MGITWTHLVNTTNHGTIFAQGRVRLPNFPPDLTIGWVGRTAEKKAILRRGCLVITVVGGRLLHCMVSLTGPWFVMLICCCSCLGANPSVIGLLGGSTEDQGLGAGPVLTDVWVSGWLGMSSGNEAMVLFCCWLVTISDAQF